MTESISSVGGAAELSPGKSPGRRRIGGLDVLRGLAAMAVLVYHYAYNYQRLFHDQKTSSPLEYGALGVQLFFIISGFVIFMTLEKTRGPIDFIRSRFSRLYPAYWAAVLLTFCVLHLFPIPAIAGADYHKYHPTFIRGILNLTMCQEMLGVGHVDAVYWTLQLELCFYLLMFLLFITGQLRRAEFFLLGVLAGSELLNRLLPAGAPALLHHPGLAIFVSDLKLLTVTSLEPAPHPRLHFFIIGIVLYKLTTHARIWDLVVLGVCVGYSAMREFGAHGTDFYFTLAFTILVYSAARGWLWFLENRATLFLGAISYSLYLTHQNIGYELIHAMEVHGAPRALALPIAAIIAIGIAAALTYGIEQPALRLLRGKKRPPHHPLPRVNADPLGTVPSTFGT